MGVWSGVCGDDIGIRPLTHPWHEASIWIRMDVDKTDLSTRPAPTTADVVVVMGDPQTNINKFRMSISIIHWGTRKFAKLKTFSPSRSCCTEGGGAIVFVAPLVTFPCWDRSSSIPNSWSGEGRFIVIIEILAIICISKPPAIIQILQFLSPTTFRAVDVCQHRTTRPSHTILNSVTGWL